MALLGNADLALQEVQPEGSVWQCLKEIETAATRGADLTRQLLAYSGKGRFVIERVSLSELVAEIGKLLEVSISKKARLKFAIEPDLPAIEADATQVRQVLMNLIVNASEAIGNERGVISVSTGARDCDRAYLSGGPGDLHPEEGTYAWVEVADTGCGMELATLQMIFDPFYSTKFAGRGLGLAAVLGIMRGHRGAIRANSEPGRGSTFRVLFPVAEKAEPSWERPPAVEDRLRGGGTILLVDDEPAILSIGRRLLESAGFTVLTAKDGRQAVDLFRMHPGQIECVILDLLMPNMDGEEALRGIRELDKYCSVLMSSGFWEEGLARRLVGQGASDFIQKPYRTTDLLEKVVQVLSR